MILFRALHLFVYLSAILFGKFRAVATQNNLRIVLVNCGRVAQSVCVAAAD